MERLARTARRPLPAMLLMVLALALALLYARVVMGAPIHRRSHHTSGARLAHAVQCRGITRLGARCTRKTSDPSEFCFQHRRQAR